MNPLEALKARRMTQQASGLAAGASSPSTAAAAAAAGTSSVPAMPGATEQLPGPSTAPPEAATKLVTGFAWVCGTCNAECVPIRTESRCLCGHRMKEHQKLTPGATCAKCTSARCTCPGFFFIVAEGSWVLRCRCKHKHVEHDPASRACKKAGCRCGAFDSPWVCNCDHPWGDHKQVVVEREMLKLAGMMAAATLQDPAAASSLAPEINRWDLVKRGEDGIP